VKVRHEKRPLIVQCARTRAQPGMCPRIRNVVPATQAAPGNSCGACDSLRRVCPPWGDPTSPLWRDQPVTSLSAAPAAAVDSGESVFSRPDAASTCPTCVSGAVDLQECAAPELAASGSIPVRMPSSSGIRPGRGPTMGATAIPSTFLRPTMIYGGPGDSKMQRLLGFVNRTSLAPLVDHGGRCSSPSRGLATRPTIEKGYLHPGRDRSWLRTVRADNLRGRLKRLRLVLCPVSSPYLRLGNYPFIAQDQCETAQAISRTISSSPRITLEMTFATTRVSLGRPEGRCAAAAPWLSGSGVSVASSPGLVRTACRLGGFWGQQRVKR
jgi:hypothetical protein